MNHRSLVRRLFVSLAVVAALSNLPFHCTFAADPAKPEEILTNASVIELQKLGLGEMVIVEKIKTSKCDFDVSLTGLKQLKEANVPDAIIQAMVATKSAPAPVEAKPAATGDSSDPLAPHEVGIWLYKETNGQKKMTKLEPEVSRMWMPTGMGFGSAIRAVLTDLHASVQTSSRRPVFYMYFGGSGQGIAGIGSPSELPLAKFDLKEKRKERLLVVGGTAAFSGVSMGIKKASLREVEKETVAAGIYKIIPKDDLADGEYGFCYVAGGMGGAGKMFCFGISAK